jgi:hypothetical protein
MSNKTRRWKYLTFTPASDTADESEETIITQRKRPSPRTLQFVNVAHPSDTTSISTIGTIRSHVAKELHAARRQLKRQTQVESLDKKCLPIIPRKKEGIEDEAITRWLLERINRVAPNSWLVDTVQRDPLSSLGRPLSNVELSLADYCTSGYMTLLAPVLSWHEI